jgi:hypothetical protein
MILFRVELSWFSFDKFLEDVGGVFESFKVQMMCGGLAFTHVFYFKRMSLIFHKGFVG